MTNRFRAMIPRSARTERRRGLLAVKAGLALGLVAIAGFASSSSAFAAAPTLSVSVPDQFQPEGTAVSGVIAQFIDPVADPTTNFTATINWGDGTSDAGTISGGAGRYAVSGAHTYADEINATITVTVGDIDGSTGVATGTAYISEADNGTTAGRTIMVAPGQLYSGPVASFSDSYLAATPADFAATIAWGDGGMTSATITGSNGNFLINGTHGYATAGTYAITVTFGEDAPSTLTGIQIASTATVATPFNSAATSIVATEGTAFTGTLGSFTDNFGAGGVGAYSVIVSWGDGTTSAGTVTSAGGSTYTVSGSHTYADESAAPLTLSYTVNDTDGTSTSAAATATVADSDAFSGTGSSLAIAPATAFTGTVATFADSNTSTSSADVAATINWGDGTITAGTVSGCCGGFSVSGTHAYAALGTYTITTSLGETAVSTRVTASGTANVVTPVTLSASAFSAAEGVAFSGQVATFSDNLGADPASNYSASINWGDGTTSAGTITASGGTNYSVAGVHTYADEGAYSVTTTVTETDGYMASGAAGATIADTDSFAGSAVSLTLGTGHAFTGAVATFTDANAAQTAADLTATITWGDGTTSAGTVTGGAGSFTVSGAHTYATAGPYTITTSLGEDSGTPSASVAGTATVVVPLTATPAAAGGGEGSAFSGTVTTFTDNLGGGSAAAYTAVIDWGDGTTSAGVVSASGAGYAVTGTHTYADEGSFPLSVAITDTDGDSTTARGAAAILDTDAFSGTGVTLTLTPGAAFSGAVATFTDANVAATAADLPSSISWGDGTTSAGTTTGAAGAFTVSGGHTYANAGSYTITVSIADDPTGTATGTATSAANVGTPVNDSLSGRPGLSFAEEGVTFHGVVGRFTDTNPAVPASAFAATIAWGDGTTSAGSTTRSSGGELLVSGSHTYATHGPRGVVVTLGVGTASATASDLMIVFAANHGHDLGAGNNAPGNSKELGAGASTAPTASPTTATLSTGGTRVSNATPAPSPASGGGATASSPTPHPVSAPTPAPASSPPPTPSPTASPTPAPTPAATAPPSPSPTCSGNGHTHSSSAGDCH